MQFSRKKLRLEENRTLPSFQSMFPRASSTQPTVETASDTSMMFEGLPPLSSINQLSDEWSPDVEAASSNEIITAFDSLDTEAATSAPSIPVEWQCRYRNGKCSEPRTLKKNGAMHSFCDYHRQLSIRNQRVFDRKKRQEVTEKNIGSK